MIGALLGFASLPQVVDVAMETARASCCDLLLFARAIPVPLLGGVLFLQDGDFPFVETVYVRQQEDSSVCLPKKTCGKPPKAGMNTFRNAIQSPVCAVHGLIIAI